MMHLFQPFIFLFILSVLASCSKDSNNSYYLSPENSSPPMVLDYGNPQGELTHTSPELEIQRVEDAICIRSRSSKLLDYGPRFTLCFDIREESEFYANYVEKSLLSARSALLKSSRVSSFPRFNLSHESGNVYVDFISENSLRTLWRGSPPKNHIIADLRLIQWLEEDNSLVWEGSPKNLSLSYGLPYWNYYGGNECFFFLSSWDLDIPANQRRFLRIQIDCDYMEPQLRKFVELVDEVNREMISNCLEELPILTEYFSLSTSRYGRFLEFHNPKNEPLCKFSFHQESNPNKNSSGWRLPTEFLFPQSTILVSNAESRLQTFLWMDDYNWNGLVSGNLNIMGISDDFEDRMSGFRFEEEHISRRKLNFPCSNDTSSYYTTEKFCGSPGLHLYENFNIGSFCSVDDIQLTELNFFGIQDNIGNINARDRYLEFLVDPKDPKDSCDISSLWLDIENQTFPLKVKDSMERIPGDAMVNKGTVLLMGLSNKLPPNIYRIPRNLFQLNPIRTIGLGEFGNPSSKKLLWNGRSVQYNTDIRILPRDSASSLYSLVPIESYDSTEKGREVGYSHHPPQEYLEWNKSNKYNKNFMSPGTVIKAIPNKYKGLSLSEVLWSGSFSNGQSILADRFLEWKSSSDSSGSFYLTILYPNAPNRNQTYLVPIEKDKFSFLSRNPLVCFPDRGGIYHNQFSLFNDPVQIVLHNGLGNIHQDVYLDTRVHGINQSSPRFRASAIYFPGEDILNSGWMNSAETYSNCEGEVAASPAQPNGSESNSFTDGRGL